MHHDRTSAQKPSPARATALAVATLVAVALAAGIASAGADGGAVLEEVRSLSRDGFIGVAIGLVADAQYVSQTLSVSNDVLQIRLRRMNDSRSDGEESSGRVTITPTGAAAQLVSEVSSAGVAGDDFTIIVRFTRVVRPTVYQGADRRTVFVGIRESELADPGSASPPREAVVPAPSPSMARPTAMPTRTSGAEPTPAPTITTPPASGRASAPRGIEMPDRFVINVQSSRTSPEPLHLPDRELFRTHAVYVVQREVAGKSWYRVRVGFFPNREAAQEAAATIRPSFPDAWVDMASDEERRQGLAISGAVDAPATPVEVSARPPASPPPPTAETPATGGATITAPPRPPGAPAAPFELSGDAMEDARRAMVAKDYPAAIRLLTKVLQSSDPKSRQEAQELLGVARERNNQLAHAKAEYQEYLRLYPTGEGADRVRQRLAALLSFGRAPSGGSAGGPAPEGGPTRSRFTTDYSGSLSQYFRRDSSIRDQEGDTINQSNLSSDVDLTGRLRADGYDLRAQFNGGYRYDIEGSSTGADTRIRYLYLEGNDRKHDLSARVGRQSRSTGGVQGRFDGVLLSYRTSPRTRINLVGGSPVDLTEANAIDTDRYFYGLSIDLGTFAEHWDGTLYAIQQQVNGILDRRAVGAELRYVRPEASLFTLVDYDISYNALNTLLAFGNYRFQNAATVGFSVDVRESPALTTSNALIGQPVDSMDALLDVYSEHQVRDLADDRTAASRSFTLSGSYPLTARLQVAGDFTLTDLSSTPSSGGVEGTPSTGLEYFYSTQLIGTDVLQPGDVHILSLRYADTSTADTTTVMLNSRLASVRQWRFTPRLRLDLQRLVDDSRLAIVRPSLLTDYRWGRALTVEIEGGYEWVTQLQGDGNNDRQGYYLYLGYRWDF